MPTYTTRIELPDASEEDYRALETEMKKANFKDLKKNIGRPSFVNPAEFNRRGRSVLEVTGAAAKAIHKTGKHYSFTVMRLRRVGVH